MTIPNDDGVEPKLSRERIQELDRLFARLCDDELTADDRRRINQILDEDSAARRYYLKYIAIHSALATTAGSYARCELNKVSRRAASFALAETVDSANVAASADCSSEASGRKRFRSSMIRLAVSMAAMLCFVAFALDWSNRAETQEQPTVQVSAANVASNQDLGPGTNQLVAEVTYVSSTVRWQNPNESYALSSRVRAGQRLVLEQGQVELTYLSGAKLLLTGPSEFLVEVAGGKLRRGELVASVPQEGHGFTIETPNGKVIDLGTEFGVVVDDFGVSQVSVFEGKVETLPMGLANASQNKIELTTGRALQWTNESVLTLDAERRRYQRPGLDALPLRLAPGVGSAAIDDRFRGNSLRSDWKTIGEVSPQADGLRMGGARESAQRPYLITRHEFDPSGGAVTVICDVRFEERPGMDNASLAILTRSADVLSTQGAEWQDMLARCVWCSFKSGSDSGEGLLEVGTKYEADRELSNISWGGFMRPQPDTLYRLTMRDDGLNVTFTVSIVDDPSVRKTISFRSLFRGTQNFICLEGSGSAYAIVERLQVFQEIRSASDPAQFVSNTAEPSSESIATNAFTSRLLDELAPSHATLILADDFDGGALDTQKWMTLEDVVLRDGQVQLGLPNIEQHIDTWHRRPYLLTRQQFEPGAGALTILGKVTFAENFLYGYGASFAVMTRADSRYENAPGWENSILQAGVRSNFWPAALGHDHSLEIQEKTPQRTISSLAAQGFQINPRSRSYLFRVVDDGKTAKLTLIDTENPDIRKSITHSTTFARASGHIGFESCWGSPTLLDNLRIYRGK